MTSVRGQRRPIQRGQAPKAPTRPLSSNGNHKDLLGSNKPRSSEAPIGSEASTGIEIPVWPEAPPGPPQAPPFPFSQDFGANRYSQQDLDRIIQTFIRVSKEGSGEKLKDKTLDVYRGRSHIECYNFCQQCEDYFATCGATKPNRIPFVASFLQDQIHFYWQQHKRKLEAESSVPISWDEVKAFLQKALGNS